MTQQKPKKAVVATVIYAGFKFPGLKLPNGEYAVTASQTWELLKFSDLPKNASRDIKRLLGKDYQTFRIASELNPKKVNVIKLEDFGLLVMKLAFKGNETAQAIAESSVTTTLEQAFDIAFDNKQKLEDYQAKQTARVQGKVTRKSFTTVVKEYVEAHSDELSDNYKKFIYNNCTDGVYRIVFGRSAKKLREAWGCKDVRDELTISEAMIIESVERLAGQLIEKLRIEPQQAIKEAGQRMLIEKIER